MARKLLLIFASLTLLVAGGTLYLALTRAPASATATRTVIVATGDLAPGTRAGTFGDGQVQTLQVASNSVPPNALGSLGEVALLQTQVPIFRGQILMRPMFAQTATTGGLSIPAGTNAITLQISDSGRVAGFVQPGSKVVVYKRAVDSQTPGEVVLTAARVIAVGPTTATGGNGEAAVSNKLAPTTLVTFALSPKDSIRVVGRDDLYLGLLPS